jgi:hypothetical protein
LSSAAVDSVGSERAGGVRARIPFYAALIAYGGLLGAGLALLVLLLAQVGSLTGLATISDVPAFYIGARMVLAGQSDALYDMGLQSRLHTELIAPYGPVGLDPFVHPPYFALFVAPLGLLALPAAYLVCTALNLTAVAYTLRRLVAGMWPARDRRIVLLACLSLPPLYVGMMLGQLPPILVWLSLTGALGALAANGERQAGLWLILGLVKPQILIAPLLALLVARRWRTLLVFGAGTAAVAGVSFLIMGFWIPEYLRFLGDYVRPGSPISEIPDKMQNWRGLVYHLLGADSGPIAAGPIGALTVASVGTVVVICWPRGGPQHPGWDVRFAVVILLGLLINPHFYPYDALIALTPGVVLWRAAASPETRARAVRTLLALGPLAGLIAETGSPPLIQVGPWYLLLLLLAVAWAWSALSAKLDPAPPSPAQQARAGVARQ